MNLSIVSQIYRRRDCWENSLGLRYCRRQARRGGGVRVTWCTPCASQRPTRVSRFFFGFSRGIFSHRVCPRRVSRLCEDLEIRSGARLRFPDHSPSLFPKEQRHHEELHSRNAPYGHRRFWRQVQAPRRDHDADLRRAHFANARSLRRRPGGPVAGEGRETTKKKRDASYFYIQTFCNTLVSYLSRGGWCWRRCSS